VIPPAPLITPLKAKVALAVVDVMVAVLLIVIGLLKVSVVAAAVESVKAPPARVSVLVFAKLLPPKLKLSVPAFTLIAPLVPKPF